LENFVRRRTVVGGGLEIEGREGGRTHRDESFRKKR
jgi:hypothetical protein